MARVTWSRPALASLYAIFVYLERANPAAAARVFLKLRNAGDALDKTPERGRLISRGRRELVHVQPYLIRYRVEHAEVIILEVRHAAREPD